MKKIFSVAIGAACLWSCGSDAVKSTANYEVVPLPAEIVMMDGEGFTLNKNTVIAYPKDDSVLRRNAELLSEYLEPLTGHTLKVTDEVPSKNAIVLKSDFDNKNKESYELMVTPEQITINGASAAGNFYGIQTLRKSIDATTVGDVYFPAVAIWDGPRFSYRGTMFDTARHYFPVDSIKSFIDMIALHNVNTLHWHITDDQGWRLEIKKYPKLTEVGSKRNGTCIGKDFESSDSIPYGGFYTQDEAREIVRYAAERHINVIPEIDLPGHMVAALTAYPELGCTGGPYEVWQRWGVSEDLLCAGNDSTMKFISDVLEEVCDIFPSEYVHIGGDECPKVRWEECAKCQARIKELGLKSDGHSTKEQKLQSWVMEEAAKTLAGRGRKMIGWDEIIEGGLFPGATVMSWRGVEGAREAAAQGHDAIMTPTNYCYFDYLQSQDADREPFGIGGYVPVSKVYQLDPTETLDEEQAKHILGAQANLWTEYILGLGHAQYMELPRLAALSEVQWMALDKKDYDEFTKRLPRLIKHYEKLGYNYAPHVFDVQGELAPDSAAHAIKVTLKTIDDAPIYYTLDGTEPTEASTQYSGPLTIDKTATIKAIAVRPDGTTPLWQESVSFNKATSAKVTLDTAPHSRYAGKGFLLTDGRFGPTSFNTGEWIGYNANPMVVTLDLGKPTEFSEMSINTLIDTDNWIFNAREIKLETSADGKVFKTVADRKYDQLKERKSEIVNNTLKFAPVKAQYVRVTADYEKSIPAWHEAGAGKPAFIFVDEIVLN